jgi:hypothetical protein
MKRAAVIIAAVVAAWYGINAIEVERQNESPASCTEQSGAWNQCPHMPWPFH